MIKEYLRPFFLFILLLICSGLFAQTNTKASAPSQENINIIVYKQSLSIADYGTAIHALYYLIAGDPTKYSNWKDTLALLYAQANAYQQAYLLSNSLLNSSGYSNMRMEIKAISAKNLRQPVEAIDAYTELFNKTNNPAYGFEELQLEYGIRRLAESIVTGNKVLQLLAQNDSLKVNVLRLDGKNAQQVSLKSATQNIIGLAYIDLKDKANAVAQLNAALKESPEFEQAKNNLNVANSLAAEK